MPRGTGVTPVKALCGILKQRPEMGHKLFIYPCCEEFGV